MGHDDGIRWRETERTARDEEEQDEDEDEEEEQEWERPYRSRNNRRQKKDNDPRFDLLVTQIVVCVVCMLVAVGIKLVGGNFYTHVKSDYVTRFDDQTRLSDVMGNADSELSSGGTSAGAVSSDGTTVIINSETDGMPAESAAPDSAATASAVTTGAPVDSSDSTASAAAEPTDHTSPNSSSSASAADTTPETSSAAAPPAAGATNVNTGISTVSAQNLTASGASFNTMILPVNAAVSSGFGYRVDPVTGVYQMHYGIDLPAPVGTGIKAAMDGTVVVAGPSSSYGNYMVLSHGNGLTTLYAHCSDFVAKVGDTVKQGQIIAKVGDTGESTGPHCHFEIRVNDVPIDPATVLPVTFA